MNKSPHVSNHILAALPPVDMAELEPHLMTIQLPQETVLYEPGDPIHRICFPGSGIISIVVDLASGEMIETAMIGRDSLVGGSAALDTHVSVNRAVVQVGGSASFLETGLARKLAEQSHKFRSTLIRHEKLILAQSQQSAACNASHSIEARLARWLLHARDLLESDEIPLAQELLAQMLGVRRTSVTVVVSALQLAGLITCGRGRIRVRDVEGLRETACECYESVRFISERLLGPKSDN